MIAVARPDAGEYAEFYRGYIAGAPAVADAEQQLRAQRTVIANLFGNLDEQRADFAYAPGKWTVKQLLGHLCDAERVMAYRLMRIARGDETPLPGFEEDDYVAAAGFERRSVRDVLEEWLSVRDATQTLMRSVPVEAWTRRGTANGHPVSARALVYIILGHAEHHLNVLKERYGV